LTVNIPVRKSAIIKLTHLFLQRPAFWPSSLIFDMNGEAYALEDAHFLRWITGGPRPAIDADAALAVQVVMDALYRSAEHNGAPVDVAERS